MEPKNKPVVIFVVFQTANQANGGVNSIVQVILNLRRVRPVFLTQLETPVNQLLRSRGIQVETIVSGRPENRLGRLFGLIRFNVLSLIFLSRWAKPLVIHCNDMQGLMHTFLPLRLLRIKWLFNFRGVLVPSRRYKRVWRLVNGAGLLFVLSDEMKNALLERLPLKEKNRNEGFFLRTYSAVDLLRFHPVNKDIKRQIQGSTGLDPASRHIVFVAAFNDLKNQLQFLKEGADWIRRSENVTIHFLGDFDPAENAYAAACAAIVKQLNLEPYLRFHDYRPNIFEYYQAADVTVLASRREGLARCMIESLACGTPVVSFDVCSAHEILTRHQCGMVVPQGHYSALFGCIDRILHEDTLYRKLRNNAVSVAGHLFEPGEVAGKYENTYLACLENQAVPGRKGKSENR